MRFDLAPMNAPLRVTTWISLPLPLVFLVLGFAGAGPDPRIQFAMFGFVLAVYASIWFLFRPTCFELTHDELHIVWPLRTRVIPRRGVTGARVVSGADFRREAGVGMRIGAGGLWGGFGLLKTSKGPTYSMWVSRTDPLVIVTLDGARPLLLTPEDPERFIAALLAR